MDKSRKALERAFELAKSGACSSIDDLKRCMVLEGYQISQIVGSTLARKLRTLIAEALEEATTVANDGKDKAARSAALRRKAPTAAFTKKRHSEIAKKAAARV